ncbi:MAG TPA: hypothetical protein VF153_01190, partial [Candidatus Limnocylindria bacterium]
MVRRRGRGAGAAERAGPTETGTRVGAGMPGRAMTCHATSGVPMEFRIEARNASEDADAGWAMVATGAPTTGAAASGAVLAAALADPLAVGVDAGMLIATGVIGNGVSGAAAGDRGIEPAGVDAALPARRDDPRLAPGAAVSRAACLALPGGPALAGAFPFAGPRPLVARAPFAVAGPSLRAFLADTAPALEPFAVAALGRNRPFGPRTGPAGASTASCAVARVAGPGVRRSILAGAAMDSLAAMKAAAVASALCFATQPSHAMPAASQQRSQTKSWQSGQKEKWLSLAPRDSLPHRSHDMPDPAVADG